MKRSIPHKDKPVLKRDKRESPKIKKEIATPSVRSGENQNESKNEK